MTGPQDLPERVGALEEQVRDIRNELRTTRTDAAAARSLAAGADRDVAQMRVELGAHTSVLNALRETQIEHGRKLDEHSRILGEHSRILSEHGRILSEHGEILGRHGEILVNVQAGVAHIVDLLERDERH